MRDGEGGVFFSHLFLENHPANPTASSMHCVFKGVQSKEESPDAGPNSPMPKSVSLTVGSAILL